MNVIFRHFSRRLTLRRFSRRIRRSLKNISRIEHISLFTYYAWHKINNKRMSLETESLSKRNDFGYKRPKTTLATISEEMFYSDTEEY